MSDSSVEEEPPAGITTPPGWTTPPGRPITTAPAGPPPPRPVQEQQTLAHRISAAVAWELGFQGDVLTYIPWDVATITRLVVSIRSMRPHERQHPNILEYRDSPQPEESDHGELAGDHMTDMNTEEGVEAATLETDSHSEEHGSELIAYESSDPEAVTGDSRRIPISGPREPLTPPPHYNANAATASTTTTWTPGQRNSRVNEIISRMEMEGRAMMTEAEVQALTAEFEAAPLEENATLSYEALFEEGTEDAEENGEADETEAKAGLMSQGFRYSKIYFDHYIAGQAVPESTTHCVRTMTWNAGGLTKPVLQELETYARDMRLDVIHIQETKWSEDYNWSGPDYVYVHSAGQNKLDKVGGLLTMISTRIASSQDVQYNSAWAGRLLHVRIPAGNASLDLLNAYQYSANDKPGTAARRQQFLQKLQRLIAGLPRRNALILSGDMNTSCEPMPHVSGPYVLPVGEYHKQDYKDFLHICEALSLIILNTWNNPKHGQIATFKFGQLSSQIDYIIVRRPQASNTARRAAVMADYPVAQWREGANHYPVMAYVPVPKRPWKTPDPGQLAAFREEVASKLQPDSDFDSIILQANALFTLYHAGRGTSLATLGPLSEMSYFYKHKLQQRKVQLYQNGQIMAPEAELACAEQLATPLTMAVNQEWQAAQVWIRQDWADANVALLPKMKQVSLDLTAAFDLVNWSHLREALALAQLDPSVQELLLQWLRQVVYYFNHRGQQTKVRPSWGLRQGCPASPVLWSVFTALLCQAFDSRLQAGWAAQHAVMYADDSHLRWQFDTYEGFERALTELRIIMRIFSRFDMCINCKKTQAILLLSGLIIAYDRFEALSTRHRLTIVNFSCLNKIGCIYNNIVLSVDNGKLDMSFQEPDQEMAEFFGIVKKGTTPGAPGAPGPEGAQKRRRETEMQRSRWSGWDVDSWENTSRHMGYRGHSGRDPLLISVARLALRHEEELKLLQQDTTMVLWFSPGQDSVLPFLYQTALTFKKKQQTEPTWGLAHVPLKQVMATAMFRELRERFTKVLQNPELLKKATDMGWRDNQGWVYQLWNPQLKHLERDHHRAPVTDVEMTNKLEFFITHLKRDVVHRFHCTRKLTETMDSKATFHLDLSVRNKHAEEIWDLMTELQGNTVFQLIGLGYRRERLGRGPGAQKVYDMLRSS
ncbi:Craniofacial development protein 2 [Symbiodinium microadriaticum]|uniref:Craniofacial development protein 2 n=1 Tax=Symbiodinium microadriaticum TaxID=2951 RepID=A0A1Q9CIR0_SYMMI|nr:Craniofacial development protein 2 [Symbiodinium microadriaticum]